MLTRKQQELLLFVHRRLQEEGIPPSFDEMKDALDLKSKSGIHRLITALEERGFIRRLPNRARALEVLRLPDGYENRSSTSDNGSVNNTDVPMGTEIGAGAQVQNISALARRGFSPSVIDGGLSMPEAETAPKMASGGSMLKQSDVNVVKGGFGEASQSNFSHDRNLEIPIMGRIAAGVPISAIENRSSSVSLPPSMVGAGEHFALKVDGNSMIEAGIHDGDTVILQRTPSASDGDIVVALIDDEEATLKRFIRQDQSILLEAANPEFKTRVFDSSRVKVQGRLVGLLRSYQ